MLLLSASDCSMYINLEPSGDQRRFEYSLLVEYSSGDWLTLPLASPVINAGVWPGFMTATLPSGPTRAKVLDNVDGLRLVPAAGADTTGGAAAASVAVGAAPLIGLKMTTRPESMAPLSGLQPVTPAAVRTCHQRTPPLSVGPPTISTMSPFASCPATPPVAG